MTHVDLADERGVCLDLLGGGIRQAELLDLAVDGSENLLYGVLAQRPLAEHIFVTGRAVEFHNSDSGAFLAAVMLLFHEQIKFPEAIAPCPVFPLIVFERFEEAYHSDATLVLENLHCLRAIFWKCKISNNRAIFTKRYEIKYILTLNRFKPLDIAVVNSNVTVIQNQTHWKNTHVYDTSLAPRAHNHLHRIGHPLRRGHHYQRHCQGRRERRPASRGIRTPSGSQRQRLCQRCHHQPWRKIHPSEREGREICNGNIVYRICRRQERYNGRLSKHEARSDRNEGILRTARRGERGRSQDPHHRQGRYSRI